MMTLIIIAIVIAVAVAFCVTMGVIANIQRKKAIKAAEKMVAQRKEIERILLRAAEEMDAQREEKERLLLSKIRAAREARARAEALEAVQKMPVEVKTKRHHRKKKTYGQLLVEEENLRGLTGHKRLVDKAGRTQVLSSLYESDKWENPFNHSHYNVRDYKVNRKADRKAKKAWQDSFVFAED